MIHRGHFRFRLGEGHSGVQAPVGMHEMQVPLGSLIRISRRKRNENVSMLPWWHKIGGHHANYGVVVSAESNRFAEDLRIAAQKVLPERIAQHDKALTPLHIFFRRNDSSEHRRNTQGFQESCIYAACANLQGLRPAGVVHIVDVDSTALRKRACLSLDIHQVWRRIVRSHSNDSLGIFVRKRIEQDAVDHAEDCCVCADSQSESENGNRREAGILAQHAEGEANVLQESFERGKCPGFAIPLFYCGGVAEVAACSVARFLRINSRETVFFFAHGEMKRDLIIEVAIKLRALPESSYSQPCLVPPLRKHEFLLRVLSGLEYSRDCARHAPPELGFLC